MIEKWGILKLFIAYIDQMDRIASANVFVTIAERGSLAGAAEALDMSRAMVTRYLAEMEQWAGRGCCTGPRAAWA